MSRLLVDGLGLVDPHFSGVGQYMLGMLEGMDQVMDDFLYNGKLPPEVVVIIPKDSVRAFKRFKFKHIGYKTFPLSFNTMNRLWYRRKLPPIDLWLGRGTYLFPRFVDMPLLFSKSLLVIHDLTYELYKQFSDENNARFLSKSVPISIKRSKMVIAVSHNTKSDIIKTYNLPNNKLTVITNAADYRKFYTRASNEIRRVRRKYGINQDYILSLGNLEPRKNVGLLVRAYCSLPKSIRDNYALLLVGVTGWKTEALFGEITEMVEKGYNIIRPSRYVTDKDKPAIISGAKMLVYPSHYEGFGMPPLEALACGTPVICADNSSLPEAVGKAARLVSSNDVEGLRLAIKDYLDNYEQVSREAMVEGPKQARKFSWVESARKLFDTIESST